MRLRAALAIAVVCLVCGAGATVAVALACWVQSRAVHTGHKVTDKQPPELAGVVPPQWLVRRFPQSPGLMIVTDEYRGTGLLILEESVTEMLPPGADKFTPDYELHLRRSGWPFAALECTMLFDLTTRSMTGNGLDGPVWLISTRTPWSFPFKPQGPGRAVWGFALDTLFYALVLAGVLVGLRAARRWWRMRSGLCLSCGYARSGLATGDACPECGAKPLPLDLSASSASLR
jgi:hypothetical protein